MPKDHIQIVAKCFMLKNRVLDVSDRVCFQQFIFKYYILFRLFSIIYKKKR